MKDYDIYLFDWDGTLANSTSVWFRAAKNQFSAHGLNPSDADVIRGMGNWNSALKAGIRQSQLDAFREGVRAEAKANLPNAPLFPGAHEVLADLKQSGKKLAVVTAMHRDIIDAMLAHHGYDETFFDVVVSGSDVAELKPHPEGLLLALDGLDRQPNDRVLMLGDTERDILAAHAAGVDSLLFFPPEHRVFHDLDDFKQHNPTHVITGWSDFS
ncbi:MAG: HAD family hydrolase [Candidatus Saccharimonadales bacterium]